MSGEWAAPEAQWVRDGSIVFQQALSRLGDGQFTLESNLSTWTKAHVIAHVSANAQAIGRLLRWAMTGERTLMYDSVEARDKEIAEGASMDPSSLRSWWQESDAHLLTSFATLPEEAWNNVVVTAQGREVPARETLWMRSREVCIHAVDLDAGVGFPDLPEEFLLRLIKEAVAKHSSGEVNSAVLLTDDDGRQWRIEGDGEQFAVTGSLGGLASWLTGRGADGVRDSHNSRPPDLAKWL